MKNLFFTFTILGLIFLTLSCDNKTKAKLIAQSVYDELLFDHEQLIQENKILKQKNRELSSQNETLKHDLKKYKNGFNSMYE